MSSVYPVRACSNHTDCRVNVHTVTALRARGMIAIMRMLANKFAEEHAVDVLDPMPALAALAVSRSSCAIRNMAMLVGTQRVVFPSQNARIAS